MQIKTNVTINEMMPADWAIYWRARAELAERFGLSEEAASARIQSQIATIAANQIDRYGASQRETSWRSIVDETVNQIVGRSPATGRVVSEHGSGAVAIQGLFAIDRAARPRRRSKTEKAVA